jgi:replicative DNA helicase
MSDFARERVGPLLVGDRPLPQALDAERAVLSCLLAEPGATMDAVFAKLQTEDCFHSAQHRKIYTCLREMAGDVSSSMIDFITIVDRLERTSMLADAGGEEYLHTLLHIVPTTAKLESYIECVREAWVLRRLIGTCSDVVSRCYEREDDISGLLDEVEQEIMSVSRMQVSDHATPIKELMTDALQHLHDLSSHETSAIGVPTGFDLDDKLSGLKPAELIVLAARPSIGKTTLAMNIARNVAVEGHGVVFFSLEMGAAQVVLRLLCAEAQINLKDVRDGRLTTTQWNHDIMVAGDRLRNAPIYIDDTPQLTSVEIRQKARRLANEHDIKMIAIDYLQLMKPSGGNRNTSREQEVAKMSSDIKALAKELNIPIILLAQLNRQAEQGGRPKLAQLRESGAIEQDADVVLLLHRDRDEAIQQEGDGALESEIIIAKNRNGETGIVKLQFRPQFTRFENPSRIADADVPAEASY